jgi:hypothetical protein
VDGGLQCVAWRTGGQGGVKEVLGRAAEKRLKRANEQKEGVEVADGAAWRIPGKLGADPAHFDVRRRKWDFKKTLGVGARWPKVAAHVTQVVVFYVAYRQAVRVNVEESDAEAARSFGSHV